jgi:uncharacterized cupin superfamily protein
VSVTTLIAWLDAVRRRDRAAMRALLGDDATWEGIRPEWRCATPDEVVDHWLERAADVTDLEAVELTATTITLRSERIAALDRALLGGVAITVELDGDGRISRMRDAPLDRGPDPFVVNLADAPWLDGRFGAWTPLATPEQGRFPQVGCNVAVLEPGQPASYYHREGDQEGFLVLRGEALLLVDGEERPLRTWDFFHCPAGTDHVIVGAGDGPCTLVAFGARARHHVVYPVSELARRHGAGVATETTRPPEAYADVEPDRPAAFDPDWLT